jgi:hypothetical protein
MVFKRFGLVCDSTAGGQLMRPQRAKKQNWLGGYREGQSLVREYYHNAQFYNNNQRIDGCKYWPPPVTGLRVQIFRTAAGVVIVHFE